MSRRKQSSQVSFEDSERIALSHAIETILGSEDKENSTSQPHLRTSLSSLEFSNIEKTPHDGTLDKSSSRQHCRKLDDKDTTPKKRHEPKKHLNSVNILCRSKKRKLEEKFKESGSSMKERMSRMSNILHSTPNVRQYGPLHPIPDANIHVLDPLGSGDSGVMVKDASGKLHPAEFVPVMVEERNGGFFMSPNINNNVSRTKESLHENKGQDDSLTNITWLKRMSAPGVSPGVDSGHQSRTQSADPHCERPPYSYSALIQFALISTPVGKMTLKEIYDWIQTNFPFFKTAKLGWKNSIRHNLSLHKIFIREPPDGPGKPAYWTLRPGTVVRLPENRLFVMEGKSGENCLQGIPRQYSFQTTSGSRACIKQADGTTQVISEHLISAPHKPKPILPRVSQSYTFVSMPLLSSAGINGLSDESNMSRKRFQRIAPKQVPCNMQRFYIPSTSDSGIDMGLFDTPKRKSSQTREGSVPVEKNREEANSVGHCNPIMSTPLKPSKSSSVMEPSSSLMESMGNFTPFKDIDYDLLRAGDLLDITPIKESGMTPIIKGVLSKGLDMTPIPTGRRRQPSITTPVVVERNEMSFDLEDLFAGSDPADGIDLANYSFSNLFSPVSKK